MGDNLRLFVPIVQVRRAPTCGPSSQLLGISSTKRAVPCRPERPPIPYLRLVMPDANATPHKPQAGLQLRASCAIVDAGQIVGDA